MIFQPISESTILSKDKNNKKHAKAYAELYYLKCFTWSTVGDRGKAHCDYPYPELTPPHTEKLKQWLIRTDYSKQKVPGTLSSLLLLSTTFSLPALVQTTVAEFTRGLLFPPMGGQTYPSRKGHSGFSWPGRQATAPRGYRPLPRRPPTLTMSSASRSKQAKDSCSEMAPKGAENIGRKRASPPCRPQPLTSLQPQALWREGAFRKVLLPPRVPPTLFSLSGVRVGGKACR